ncbi:MAG: bifunctional diaminohydroxyphosphoribosylaminopyrimidine deaminase/5-amino-6-(5-phosphoribosylamino)uracil reductase RibD [Desulfobacterales bacterium]|nr:bifunctional diaminohydroxyphosphoribosylaminopyrimidine deaminase/5-amino-6-(5-phosphoribosylamino)uracil reductase RibD [Desulfobacterales bacterium]
MNDDHYMQMALDLARKGQGFTSPNPLVGAVVVNDDRVVGKGFHMAAGKAHAEVNAIDDAGDRSRGATLYVTLEPCNHEGRTPPCTEKILQSGLKRVVVAMEDPNPDVKGGGIAYLRDRHVQVCVGVCRETAERMNESFIKFIRTRRPFVIVKCAATLDGQIATKTGDSRWVSGPEARRFVHQLRHAVDAVMVGIGTVKADDPSLTVRLSGADGAVEGKDPRRVVLDANLSISENANILRLASESDTILVVAGHKSGKEFNSKKTALEKKGVKVISSPGENGLIDLDILMDQLGAMGITSLLVEGGGRVIASAFQAGIVDKINFFYAPKILGGNDGVPICSGNGPALMNQCIRVRDIRVQRFGDDIMIEGYAGEPG